MSKHSKYGSGETPPKDRIYTVVDCNRPGVVVGYAEARKRTKGRGWMKRSSTVEDAVAYYRGVTGEDPPEVPALPAGPRPEQKTEHTDRSPHAISGRSLRRVRVETERGVIDKVPTDGEIEALRAARLWP